MDPREILLGEPTVPPYAPRGCVARALSVRTEQGKTEQEKGEYLLPTVLNVARTERLQQGPARCAQSPAQPERTERGGVAYGQACGGDRRRRSDGDDAGG